MDKPQKKPTKTYMFETTKVLSVVFEMGFIIALPIVGLGFIGKILDRKHHTEIFVYIAIVLALSLSSLWLYKRFSELVKKLQQAANSKNQKID